MGVSYNVIKEISKNESPAKKQPLSTSATKVEGPKENELKIRELTDQLKLMSNEN